MALMLYNFLILQRLT